MKRVLIFRDVIVYENSKPQNMCWGKIERDRSGSQRHPEPPRRMPGNTALWFPLLAILAAPRWKEVGDLCDSTKAQAERPRSQAGL